MSLIKCPKCGNTVDSANKYCPECGNQLSASDSYHTQPVSNRPYYQHTQQYPAYQHQAPQKKSGINILLYALIALAAIGVGVLGYMLISDSGRGGGSDGAAVDSAAVPVEKVDTIKRVVEVEVPAPAPAPEVKKPENYLPDGYYYLYGRISGKKSSNDVSFEFNISNGQVSSGTYVNHTAADGSTYVNLHRSGNTISGDGYDNIGEYFKFSFTAKSYNQFSGALYFGGKLRMNLTLTKQ